MQAFIFIASLVLTLYTFIDCARRDDSQIKKIPKWGWLLAIVLLQPFGGIAYLVIGASAENVVRVLPSAACCHQMMIQIFYADSN